MQGYIKLHRQIREKAFYKKPKYLAIWIELLLNANHKDNEFIWNNETIIVKEGQCIISQLKLAEKFGISLGTVSRILKYFENENQIGKQTTNKYTMVTIKNWDTFQSGNQNGNQIENKLKTNGKQIETNNNDKNEKNEEEVQEKEFTFVLKRDTHIDNVSQEYRDKLKEYINNLGNTHILSYDDFISALQQKHSYKYKDYRKTYHNWAKRQNGTHKQESKGSIKSRLDYQYDPEKHKQRLEELKELGFD